MLVFVLVVAAAVGLAAGLVTGQVALVWAALGLSLVGTALMAFVLLRGRSRRAPTVDTPPVPVDSPPTEGTPAASVDLPPVEGALADASLVDGIPVASVDLPPTEGTPAAESGSAAETAGPEAEVVLAAEGTAAEPRAAVAMVAQAAPEVGARESGAAEAGAREAAAAAQVVSEAEAAEAEAAAQVVSEAGLGANSVAEGAGSEPLGESSDLIVRVLPGRRRFHVEDCRLLAGHAPEEISLGEARDEGFTACTACIPRRESLASV